jgi:hypothetical protein
VCNIIESLYKRIIIIYMTKNIGTTDRIIRVIIALVLFFLVGIFENKIIQVFVLIASLLTLFTVVTGWCGLYRVFGINTCKIK